MDKPSPKKPAPRSASSAVPPSATIRRSARRREAIGTGIARMGYSLVFGGGGLGLMGVVARAALDGGSEIQGIMPGFLQALEPGVSPRKS